MAASLRSALSAVRTTRLSSFLQVGNKINTQVVRGKKRFVRPMLKSFYQRRVEQGPEPERHRSEWINWNYDSELYAFGKRLGEDFQSQTLRTAFTHRSYIEKEESKRQELGLDDGESSLNMDDNSTLAEKGGKLSSQYVKAYLRHCLPRVPAEGIQSIHDNLLSDESLAHLARNLGFSDLILCQDFPPETSTLSSTFKSVVGALLQDQEAERACKLMEGLGSERACKFIEDFVLTQLCGQTVEDLWEVINPMGLLADLLAADNRQPPEPRLIWQTGSQTVVAAYLVGIYSDQQLIGKGPGETVTIAEEMAARDALSRLLGTGQEKKPFKFEQTKPYVDLANLKLSVDI